MPGQPTRIEIPPEIEAEMTPAVKAFVASLIELQAQQLEALTKKCDALAAQVQTLTERSQAFADQVQKLTEKSQKSTPRNSSLPPSAVQRPAANRGELVKRFLVDEGVGKEARFWKPTDNPKKLCPTGSEDRRRVEVVLGHKLGQGL
jgi:hypothetical protein